MATDGLKLCRTCGEVKSKSDFGYRVQAPDGLKPKCKACESSYNAQYRVANSEKLKAQSAAYVRKTAARKSEYDAAYYAQNSDWIKSRVSAWRLDNLVAVEEARRRYYRANQGKIAARAADWSRRNRAKENLRISAWRKANPESGRVNASRRRAKLRAAGGKHTIQDLRELMRLQRGKCACCHVGLEGGWHSDHIIALANGGSNDKTNLQLLCPACNLKKNARDPIEFMQSQGRLL